MFFIKPCPACGRKLRFPLDRGTIKVKCPCGESFTVNPDDPSTYREGSFDLRGRSRKKNSFLDRLDSFREIHGLHELKAVLIKKALHFVYTAQNFRLLPAKQQRRIIAVAVLLLAAVLLIAWWAAGAGQRPVPRDGLSL